VSQDSVETQNPSVFSATDLGADQNPTDTDNAQEESGSKEDKGKEREASVPEDPHDSAVSSESSDAGGGIVESASHRYVIVWLFQTHSELTKCRRIPLPRTESGTPTILPLVNQVRAEQSAEQGDLRGLSNLDCVNHLQIIN